MPIVERPAVAILLDSFIPQPYRANITEIKPNVSPRVPAAAKFQVHDPAEQQVEPDAKLESAQAIISFGRSQ
jgi:hypothetical protein